MTDRMFADCCYGSDHQHLPSDPCPQDQMEALAGLERLATVGEQQRDPWGKPPVREPSDKFVPIAAALMAVATIYLFLGA